MQDWTNIQLENAYPTLPDVISPFGTKILVQYRLERSYTKTGIILDALKGAKKDGDFNQTVKIIKLPKTAFHIRGENGALVPYTEDPWFKEGDYVRIPRIGMDNLFFPFGQNTDFRNYIKKISDQAREALDAVEKKPLYAYIADQGYMEGRRNVIPLALVDFRDVVAAVSDPLLPLNGLDEALDNQDTPIPVASKPSSLILPTGTFIS